MRNKVVVLVGPTGAGKTSLALRLSAEFNGAIISADSRQVVRFMDTATGKIPGSGNFTDIKKGDGLWEINSVSVFGYDLINPDEYFSAYDYVNYVQKIFPRHSHKGNITFIVGGTGLYVDSLTGRTKLSRIEPNPELRKKIDKLSTEDLASKLQELDPQTYSKIDRKNPARLIRAIEKASSASSGTAQTPPVIKDPVYIGLMASRDLLYKKSDDWLECVFGEELFEEIKLIRQRFPDTGKLNGLVYKSAAAYLDGSYTLEDAKQRAKYDLHAYIRRQQTWFKRNPQIGWFDITQKNFDGGIKSIVESMIDG